MYALPATPPAIVITGDYPVNPNPLFVANDASTPVIVVPADPTPQVIVVPANPYPYYGYNHRGFFGHRGHGGLLGALGNIL